MKPVEQLRRNAEEAKERAKTAPVSDPLSRFMGYDDATRALLLQAEHAAELAAQDAYKQEAHERTSAGGKESAVTRGELAAARAEVIHDLDAEISNPSLSKAARARYILRRWSQVTDLPAPSERTILNAL